MWTVLTEKKPKPFQCLCVCVCTRHYRRTLCILLSDCGLVRISGAAMSEAGVSRVSVESTRCFYCNQEKKNPDLKKRVSEDKVLAFRFA